MAIPKVYKWNNNGTKQKDRLPDALSPGYVDIDERSFEDLFAQMAEYARRVIYYDDENKPEEEGWKAFFEELYDYSKKSVGADALHMDLLEEQMRNGDVKPHVALMLAFLKLFQIEQENLNKVTERHLLFYYNEILQFKKREGKVGKAVLFLTPLNNIQEIFVPRDTRFDAGKDSYGKPIFYKSANDLTVNRLQVKELKRLFDGTFLPISSNNMGAPKAGTDARQKDQVAEETVGFAVSSPLFFLPDGTRYVAFRGKAGAVISLPEDIIVEYTGQEGWLQAGIENGKVVVEGSQGAIVAYNTSLHGLGYAPTTCPILRFCLSKSAAPGVMEVFRYFDHLWVTVEESQNFIIEGADGVLPNTVGTMPFGPRPCKMDSFVLSIPNDGLEQITCASLHLNRGKEQFSGAFLHYNLPDAGIGVTTYENKVKFVLTKSLGWEDITSKMLDAIYDQFLDKWEQRNGRAHTAPSKSTVALPQPSSLSFFLPATISFELSDRGLGKKKITEPTSFYSVTPFGVYPVNHVKQLAEDPIYALRAASSSLTRKSSTLFIKLDNMAASEGVSIYFKMNPLVYDAERNPVGTSPQWYYRSTRGWEPLDQTKVASDSTEGFQHSGIIRLSFGPEILCALREGLENSLWLMVSAEAEIDKFAALEEVRTQAVEVEYDPRSEGQAPKGKSLPSGSIKKMIDGPVGIKKIEQPYDSDEGESDESDVSFKCRVSEKLRHKGRAWTPWDYERLVLERFPQLIGVKCLPCCGGQGKLQPGSVTLLVIPNSRLIRQPDPLRPSVGKALQLEIEAYIKERTSPFAHIRVVSPSYRAAVVSCRLKLKKPFFDKKHYASLLNDRLIGFFAPWTSLSGAIEFKTSQNESHIEEFIESQEYVDHIEQFRLDVQGVEIREGAPLSPEESLCILTSAATHNIIFE